MPKKTKAGGGDEAEAFQPPKPPAPKNAVQRVKEASLEAISEDPQSRFAFWSLLNPSSFEAKVWKFLGGEDNPWRFAPQVIVGPYTCDFLSRKYMLCIEADGPDHLFSDADDARRDAYLETQGITTLRLIPADFNLHTKQELYHLVEAMVATRNIVMVKKKKGTP